MKKTLEQLIKYRENDLVVAIETGQATKDEETHFTELIIAVTRLINDIRYCSRKNCPCSPERDIAFHYEKVEKILSKTSMALFPVPIGRLKEIADKYGDKE